MEVNRASARGGRRVPAAAQMRLHGRDRERRRIDQLIAGAHSGRGGALLLQGEVGTGKSALLEHALARASGMRVLRCQCDQAESDTASAALHQLLRPVLPLLDELPERLAGPLRHALGVGAGEPDRFLVGAGVLALLAGAARERPLLCVVDDGQWLDRPSAGALSFAARRLSGEGVVLLVAVREGEGRPFEPAGVARTCLRGLDPGAARGLLAEQAGPSLAPEVARRLVERTGGLPLALVDAVAGLSQAQLAGRAPLSRPLPLSPRLRDAFLQRVRGLPGPTQRLLLVVAAAGSERIDVIVGAGAVLGIELSALENAEAAALVQIDQDGVRFRSPLVHSAVYHQATFFERRAAHLALAHALGEDDDDRRAWHLAAAALSCDAEVAAGLERAAERAGLRRELSTRAAALQRAAELTPEGAERGRRLSAAAGACWQAGRTVRASELLCRAERLRPDALLGADIAELRGSIQLSGYDLEGARDSLVAGAERVAAVSPERALELLVQAARIAVACSDAGAARALANRAQALSGDREGRAALVRGVAGVVDGRFEEASRLAGSAFSMAGDAGSRGGHLLDLAAALSAGNDLAPAALAAALGRLAAEVGRLRADGADGMLPGALASLAWLELWTDRHRSALANASEGLALARDLGQRWVEGGCAMTLAVLAALRGQEEERRTLAELLLHPPGVQSAATHAGAAAWAAALADLGACRFAEALTRLEELAPGRRLADPWHALWSRPDAVEAAVRTGRPDAARTALDVLERAAAPDWPAPAAALLARSRALLATGREAERHYLAALALHAQDQRPFQEARTRLLWAEHLRRNRRRMDAREQLRAALEAFVRMEARPWAARAHAELRATGETVHRDRADCDPLTPQEVRIAELVAQGGSNREVAERLFLSPRTVGYHLAKIYQKLGVSSRTRLAHVLIEDELQEGRTESGRLARPGLSGRARAAFRSRRRAPAGFDPTVPDSRAS